MLTVRIEAVSAMSGSKACALVTFLLLATTRSAVAEPAIKQAAVLGHHTKSAAAVSFSRNGVLATTGLDRTIKLWDLKRRRVVGTIGDLPAGGEGTWDRDVVFSSDGKLLATAASGRAIQVFDAKTKRQLWRKVAGARSLAFSPKGSKLVSADWEDGAIKVWDARTGKLLKTLKGTEGVVGAGCWSQGTVQFAPDGKSFATAVGGADMGAKRIPTTLTIWDTETLTARTTIVAHSGRVHAMAYAPDGKTIALGGVDGRIRMYRLPVWPQAAKATKKRVDQLINQLDHKEFAKREAAQKELKKLGSAVHAALRTAVKTTKSPEIRFRAGRILAAAARNAMPTLTAILRGHRGTVMGITYSPDGRFLATCSREYRRGRGRIIVWQAADTSRPFFQWNGAGMTSIQFSADGRHMASSGQDSKVILWQITGLKNDRKAE